MKTIIILASTKKEALEIANRETEKLEFQSVYKYSKGKGNNFYQFVINP
jgi:hypothetical protein